eukprot:786108-Prymnesium_polylepis.1
MPPPGVVEGARPHAHSRRRPESYHDATVAAGVSSSIVLKRSTSSDEPMQSGLRDAASRSARAVRAGAQIASQWAPPALFDPVGLHNAGCARCDHVCVGVVCIAGWGERRARALVDALDLDVEDRTARDAVGRLAAGPAGEFQRGAGVERDGC